jgi:hypothetical protein
MTFPNPFETNPIPGLQGVAESIDLDSAAVQRIATALYQRALEPLEKDKRKVAALKGKLVRPVAQSLRAEDSRTLTAMGQRLRQDAAAQVADTDAEIMLLASRLGARQSAGELPAKGIGAAIGVPTIDQPPPCEGAIRPRGWHEKPSWQISQADCPAGWGLVSSEITGLWCCPPGQGGAGGGPPGDSGGNTGPSGVACPPCLPAPPAPCEPCPVGVPPGGTLAGDADACRKPDNTTPQAVYIVPWLGAEVQGASYDSDCGLKSIREADAGRKAASGLAEALTSFAALDAWLPQAPEGVPPPIPFAADRGEDGLDDGQIGYLGDGLGGTR